MIDRILDLMLSRGLNANEEDVIAIIKALRVPTDMMYRARPIHIPERADWDRIWGWQIEAMLEDSSQTPRTVHKSPDEMT